MQRYHPCFPTLEEVNDQKNLPYSDHLPVMADIPVENGKENQNAIRCVSWNILDPFFQAGTDIFMEILRLKEKGWWPILFNK